MSSYSLCPPCADDVMSTVATTMYEMGPIARVILLRMGQVVNFLAVEWRMESGGRAMDGEGGRTCSPRDNNKPK